MNISLETVAIVGVILNSAGVAIKAVPKIKNEFIPMILATLGAVGYGAVEGFSGPNVVIGVGVGLGAVGAHQVMTKTIASKEKTDSTPPT